MNGAGEQLTLFGHGTWSGKTCRALSAQGNRRARISASSWKKPPELRTAAYQYLDLREGYGNLLGPYWDINSPLLGGYWTLNTGPAPPSGGAVSILSLILTDTVPQKYYLSKTACLGILRRSRSRGKTLPPRLEAALKAQAGLTKPEFQPIQTEAYHINQRCEGIDLGGISGALMATQNTQMQTFVTQGPMPPANNCVTPWDTQHSRVYTPDGVSPTLAGADGGGGRNPAGLLYVAGVVAKGNGECTLTTEKHATLTTGGGQAGQPQPRQLTEDEQGEELDDEADGMTMTGGQ